MVIQILEQKWGRERTKRQGEIFAYELPLGWKELFRASWQAFFEFGYYLRQNLLMTRHLHTGWGSLIHLPKIGITDRYARLLIVSGTIKARGHSPLHLKGPHVVAHAALHKAYD